MKRRISLSIALALGVVLLSLIESDSTAHAQNQLRPVEDTGVVTLGTDQTLRIMAEWGRTDGVTVRFRQIEYGEDTCTGDVCKLTMASQNTSAPIMMMPGEAASIAVDPSDANVIYVLVVVLSNSRNANVNASIIDNATGKVVAAYRVNITVTE